MRATPGRLKAGTPYSWGSAFGACVKNALSHIPPPRPRNPSKTEDENEDENESFHLIQAKFPLTNSGLRRILRLHDAAMGGGLFGRAAEGAGLDFDRGRGAGHRTVSNGARGRPAYFCLRQWRQRGERVPLRYRPRQGRFR